MPLLPRLDGGVAATAAHVAAADVESSTMLPTRTRMQVDAHPFRVWLLLVMLSELGDGVVD